MLSNQCGDTHKLLKNAPLSIVAVRLWQRWSHTCKPIVLVKTCDLAQLMLLRMITRPTLKTNLKLILPSVNRSKLKKCSPIFSKIRRACTE
ncbi:unnamed protein product [Moneuplotes crassus]|uniref:Uncharacterized protein n=1 Tax=Euplotes crassus TaxID=5936 RepID=A0AAD1Y848_EUPCR|nr:unnamed protein product [Moneuplotes crassus]